MPAEATPRTAQRFSSLYLMRCGIFCLQMISTSDTLQPAFIAHETDNRHIVLSAGRCTCRSGPAWKRELPAPRSMPGSRFYQRYDALFYSPELCAAIAVPMPSPAAGISQHAANKFLSVLHDGHICHLWSLCCSAKMCVTLFRDESAARRASQETAELLRPITDVQTSSLQGGTEQAQALHAVTTFPPGVPDAQRSWYSFFRKRIVSMRGALRVPKTLQQDFGKGESMATGRHSKPKKGWTYGNYICAYCERYVGNPNLQDGGLSDLTYNREQGYCYKTGSRLQTVSSRSACSSFELSREAKRFERP